ncbi:MAG TPA: ABC transporter permease [Phycisphaerales bacterium]|nr:ABC transporter permease [Phycisphaerales bacterium]
MFSKDVRFGRAATVGQIVRIGARSVGIVALVCGCIGLILAIQMEPPLSTFGQTDKIANIVGVAVLRELGPLISAIVLTGFAGAAIAAELGTMVVGEEIEALEAQALNPIRFLAVPRVLATVLSLILLTIIGDVVAITTAGIVSIELLGVPYELYKVNTLSQISLSDFTTGLFKAGVFGLILSGIACYNGFKVSGGAAGVGKATTDTVVQTVVTIVIADLMFTAIFYQLGWA